MERALCPVVIGRERELTELEDALLQANRGQGQVVLLAGDAGMGKTRLTAELQRRAQQVGMTVLLGGCSEADLALPYLPFLEAIGNHLEGADLAALSEELGATRDELGHLFPQLRGRSVSGDHGDATQVKLRLFEGVHALLAIAARSTGLLLILEDLHWADASTRELLDYLCRRIRNSRVLVLGSYRRDEMHRRHPLLPTVQGWRRSGLATVLELEPLDPDGVGEMVRAMLDAVSVGTELRAFLHQRSEGNPFVLEELVKAALDRGDIFRTETGWDRLALSEFKLPETVRDTVLLRVDRLQQEEAEILRTAAVLGNTFDYSVLAAVTGLREAEVRAALSTCVQQQLLEDLPAHRGSYRFRHALTREAIYDDMIVPDRESLHSRAATVLEARPESPPIEIAHHLFEASEFERAVPLCLAAAAEAAARFAFAEATALYERALPHLTDPHQRARTLCELGECRSRAGDTSAANRYLSQGVVLLEKLGEGAVAAGFRITLGQTLQQGGDHAGAKAEFESALRVLEPLGPSSDLALVHTRRAFMRMVDFDLEASAAESRLAIEIAEAVGADLPRLLAMSYLGPALAAMARLDEGIALMDRAAAEAEALGYTWVASNILYNALVQLPWERTSEQRARVPELRRLDLAGRLANLADGISLARAGYISRAIQPLEVAKRLAEEVGAPTFVRQAAAVLARCYARQGRLDDARRVIPTLADEAQRQDQMVLLTQIATLRLAEGDLVAFRVAVERLQKVLRGSTMPIRQRVPLLLAGDALDHGLTELAGSLVESAPEILGDPLRVMVLAQLALSRGQEPAGADLVALRERFAELDMPLLVDRARRVLAIQLLRSGDRAGAEAELRAAHRGSIERGDQLDAGLAVALLHGLGLAVAAEAPSPATPSTTGERLVTVLFCDIRGYTALAQEEAPASLADRISAFQRWAQQEVHRHHGVVDKFAGDAVMATFNVSGDQVGHTLHALQAGLAIRDRAAFLGFQIGVGIATGAAVVGSLANGANLSVIGEATNLASRLQAQAGPGQLVLSEEAHRRVRSALGSEGLEAALEQFVLKGFDAPVGAYRIDAK